MIILGALHEHTAPLRLYHEDGDWAEPVGRRRSPFLGLWRRVAREDFPRIAAVPAFGPLGLNTELIICCKDLNEDIRSICEVNSSCSQSRSILCRTWWRNSRAIDDASVVHNTLGHDGPCFEICRGLVLPERQTPGGRCGHFRAGRLRWSTADGYRLKPRFGSPSDCTSTVEGVMRTSPSGASALTA